jgi:hypothetical protein
LAGGGAVGAASGWKSLPILIPSISTSSSRRSWRCVESGEPPRLFGVEPPESCIQAVRIVDMNGSNAWAEFAGVYPDSRPPTLSTSKAKTKLKGLAKR